MPIGIDIDEVLFPLVRHICPFLNRKYGINLEESQFLSYRFEENPNYLINGVQATKHQAVDDFYEFIQTPEFKSIKPFPEAARAVYELKQLDWIIAVTSRQDELDLRDHTKWQLEHFFPKTFQDVVFGNQHAKNLSPSISKQQLCQENYVSLLLEDNLEYASAVSHDIPVILFRKFWNKDVDRMNAPNIHPVSGWDEVFPTAKSVLKK